MPVPPPGQPEPELGPAVIQPAAPDPEQYKVHGFVEQYGVTQAPERTGPKPKSHLPGAIGLMLVAVATVLAGVLLISIRDDLAVALTVYPEITNQYEMMLWIQSTLMAENRAAISGIVFVAPLIALVGAILGIVAAISNRGRTMGFWAITLWLLTPLLLWGYLAWGIRLGI